MSCLQPLAMSTFRAMRGESHVMHMSMSVTYGNLRSARDAVICSGRWLHAGWRYLMSNGCKPLAAAACRIESRLGCRSLEAMSWQDNGRPCGHHKRHAGIAIALMCQVLLLLLVASPPQAQAQVRPVSVASVVVVETGEPLYRQPTGDPEAWIIPPSIDNTMLLLGLTSHVWIGTRYRPHPDRLLTIGDTFIEAASGRLVRIDPWCCEDANAPSLSELVSTVPQVRSLLLRLSPLTVKPDDVDNPRVTEPCTELVRPVVRMSADRTHILWSNFYAVERNERRDEYCWARHDTSVLSNAQIKGRLNSRQLIVQLDDEQGGSTWIIVEADTGAIVSAPHGIQLIKAEDVATIREHSRQRAEQKCRIRAELRSNLPEETVRQREGSCLFDANERVNQQIYIHFFGTKRISSGGK